VEKLLDEAGKTAGKNSSGDSVKPIKPVSSNTVAFPESFAAAVPGDAAAKPLPRK
jgi:penicillin-binding protein 1A